MESKQYLLDVNNFQPEPTLEQTTVVIVITKDEYQTITSDIARLSSSRKKAREIAAKKKGKTETRELKHVPGEFKFLIPLATPTPTSTVVELDNNCSTWTPLHEAVDTKDECAAVVMTLSDWRCLKESLDAVIAMRERVRAATAKRRGDGKPVIPRKLDIKTFKFAILTPSTQ
jgi:PHD/YefM family antitoxin component YafN of YafNO toxin-antitoxin module